MNPASRNANPDQVARYADMFSAMGTEPKAPHSATPPYRPPGRACRGRDSGGTGHPQFDPLEFAKPGAPRLDFVFTVCDNAAKEGCPVWPGQPMTAHWGVPDPAAVDGTPEQIEKAFREAFMILDRRISLFLCLPLSSLDTLAIKTEIDRIGKQ